MNSPWISRLKCVTTLLFFTLACSTGGVKKELNYSLLDIQNTLRNVLDVGFERVSSNQRVFISKAFRSLSISPKIEELKPTDKVRIFSEIRVLGDKRPYDLVITSTREVLEGKQWVSDGEDRQTSQRLLALIEAQLIKNKDQNLIDHFRPF